MSCPFCQLDSSDISNTIIEETKDFIVTPSKGSLCTGYILIIPKVHITSINDLKDKSELIKIIKKYREIFKSKYGKYPIIFEHGTYTQDNKSSCSSVIHAHLHIVNHNFLNEESIIQDLNMSQVDINEFFLNTNKNYISYISPDYKFYITYNFKAISQIMRIKISKDLNIDNMFNWRNFNFENNIINTIKTLKN